MVERLAQSVEEIIQGCSPRLDFEGSVARIPQRICASSRVAPELYCIYFDLLKAVRRDDLDACARLLSEMDTRIDAPLPPFYGRWGGLLESTARRYLTYLNVDPTSRINFKALPSSEFDNVSRLADDAFRVLERVAPEIAAEICSLITEIVFGSGVPNEFVWRGNLVLLLWGAVSQRRETPSPSTDDRRPHPRERARPPLLALSG